MENVMGDGRCVMADWRCAWASLPTVTHQKARRLKNFSISPGRAIGRQLLIADLRVPMEKRTGAGPRVTRVTRVSDRSDLGWTVRAWASLSRVAHRQVSACRVGQLHSYGASQFALRILQRAGHSRTGDTAEYSREHNNGQAQTRSDQNTWASRPCRCPFLSISNPLPASCFTVPT